MAQPRKNTQSGGPQLTPPKAKQDRPRFPGGLGDKADTSKHAEEVVSVAKGKDIVEQPAPREERPPGFDRKEMMVVRSWMERRPLEPASPATAMIEYPRMWTTKRGRYCKFKAPGGGVYALLRARPSF
jgi:hypothetical protein